MLVISIRSGGRLAAPAQAASLRETLAGRLTDPRKRQGIRHSPASLVPVLVAGMACGYSAPLAIAQAAEGTLANPCAPARGGRQKTLSRTSSESAVSRA